VCGHSASTLWNPKIQGNAILDDFCRSLIEISEFRPATLCLYTSGSFLDDGEIPWSVCATILAEVAALGWVKTVCIESLPHFVTPQRLDVLRKEFPSLSFSIAMGVDSIDRFVRYFCFQRTTPLSRYETAIQHCRDRGIETVAYVVHKPPFLTVEESVADTALSIQGAFDLGFSFVSIEPVTLQAGTLQSLLRTSNLYDLPNIWSIASVLAAFASIDKAEVQNLQRVRLGGQVFTPLPNTVMTCCKDCLALIHSRLSFLPRDFFGELALAAPGDCCKNQQFWLGTRREIESVVGRAGSIISKASDFLTSS
jgi:radical SAM enzyme (TIGR01210 family)